MACAYIGIGSNKGKRIRNAKEALARIREEMRVEKVSSFYLTEPIEVNPVREGFSNGVKGEWFVNCVLEVTTNQEPRELLRTLLKIEGKMGRIRIKQKKISRIIDLDLLLYEEKIIKEKELTLPHPLLHKRRFVLAPLTEINPDVYHPLLKKPVKEILRALTDNHAVEKILGHQDVCS